MASIKLDNNTPCEYICSVIQKLINDYNTQGLAEGELVLTLEIRKIIESRDGPLLLEHNKENMS